MSVKDSEIFEEMMRRIEDRLRVADEVFAARGLTELSNPRRDASVSFDEDERIRVEFVHSSSVPFTPAAVSSVVWDFLKKEEIKMNNARVTVRWRVRMLARLAVASANLQDLVLVV